MSEARSAGLVIASGSTCPPFAEDIATHLDTEPIPMDRRQFSNTELYTQYEESIRGKDVFVVQIHDSQSERPNWSINDAIMEQVIMIDAAKRASAAHITAVCPYLGYSRQDRKDDGREPISAAAVTRMLIGAGAERIMSIDLHSGQSQGFIDEPYDQIKAHLVLQPWLGDWIQGKGQENVVIVSPDSGRAKMAEKYANKLGVELAFVNKDRSRDSSRVTARNIIGEVIGKYCVFVDDMIDTAKTLGAAGCIVEREGALGSIALATHGILSGGAVENLANSPIEQIVVTDSIWQRYKRQAMPQLEVVSVTGLFADAIKEVHYNGSVSALFDD